MSDTLSHMAAVSLGEMPVIGPRPAPFFAPQAPLPAASLADAAAALRAAAVPPPSPQPWLPVAPRLVSDPALIDRPTPSLRRLVQATAAVGDPIAPRSAWSAPPAEDMSPGPYPVDEGSTAVGQAAGPRMAGPRTAGRESLAGPESTVGQPAIRATEPMASPRPHTRPEAAPTRQGQPGESADLEPAQPAPTRPISESTAVAGSRRAGSTAAEAEAVGQDRPGPSSRPTPVEGVPAAVEPAPGKTRPADSIGQEAAEARPGKAAQQPPGRPTAAGSSELDSAGTAHRQAGPMLPDSLVPDSAGPDLVGPDLVGPDLIGPDLIGNDPAPGIIPGQAKPGEQVQPELAVAGLESVEPAPLAIDRPEARPAGAQSKAEIQTITTRPENVNPLPVGSATPVIPRPIQAAFGQVQALAEHGQAPVEQGQAPAEHGQVPAGHGQVPAEHETSRPLRAILGPAVNPEPAPATPAIDSAGRMRPGPDQPAPGGATGNNQGAAPAASADGRSSAVSQPAQATGAGQARPALEPGSNEARQRLPLARPVQSDQPQSPAGGQGDRSDSTAIRPDVGPPIQPALPPLPGAADRPAATTPPRPTVEITIGRVEVRLRPEAARPPQAAPRPKPALSLDDYLSRQGGRR